jgi:hypothetical protein
VLNYKTKIKFDESNKEMSIPPRQTRKYGGKSYRKKSNRKRKNNKKSRKNKKNKK